MTLPLQRSSSIYLAVRTLLHLTFRRYFRLAVTGLEHWPAAGPVILCPKHQRWEDIPVVGMTFPSPLYFIAKAELFRSWWQRRLLGALGGVPLDRSCPQATLSTFRNLHRILKGREHLVLFPEGTYVPGTVGPGKHRLIGLLLSLQQRLHLPALPFVPIGIAYRPSPPGWQVQVNVGPPLAASRPDQAEVLTGALMEAISRLSA